MDAALRKGLQAAEISPVSGSVQHAAVALILNGEENEILFIRRADDPNDPWSGQIALPGGRHEPNDESLLQTALRETEEEVGVLLHNDQCLGELPAVRARARREIREMWVTPYVFRWDGDRPETTPNHELAEVIWFPLPHLLRPSLKTEVRLQHKGHTLKFPAIQLSKHKLWGLTYGIMMSLLDVITQAEVDQLKPQ